VIDVHSRRAPIQIDMQPIDSVLYDREQTSNRAFDEGPVRRSHSGSCPGDFVKVECIACGHDALMPESSRVHA
jgi:hypothetical protein